MIRRSFLTAMVIAMCWIPLGTHADDRVTKAANLIDNLISEITMLRVADTSNPFERRSEVRRVLYDFFDVKTITSFSAGRYWRAASDEEKEQYAQLMIGALCETIYNNFDSLKGLAYTSGESKPKGDRFVIVGGSFTDSKTNRPPVSINWRVLTREGQPPRIFDIEVENLSLLVTQKQENEAVIRQNKGRFSALIEAMEERVAKSEDKGCL